MNTKTVRSAWAITCLYFVAFPGVTAAQDPVPPAPDTTQGTLPVSRATVWVRATTPELTLYRVTGDNAGDVMEGNFSVLSEEDIELLCEAPCELQLEHGRYPLAIGGGSDLPVAVEGAVEINESVRLDLEYTEYATLRTVGLIVLIAGLTIGAGLMGAGAALGDEADPRTMSPATVNAPLMATGAILMVGSAFFFAFQLLFQDEARVRTTGFYE